MAQWWGRSPPSKVARVQIPVSTPYVVWVCCWFSSLLREVFLRVLRFPRLLKNQAHPGDAPPIFRPNWGPKKFFWDRPPHPLSESLDPPLRLSSYFNSQGRLNPLKIVLRPRSDSLICSGSLSPMYGCIANKQSCLISPLITWILYDFYPKTCFTLISPSFYMKKWKDKFEARESQLHVNSLSPKSNQHQIPPCNINAL